VDLKKIIFYALFVFFTIVCGAYFKLIFLDSEFIFEYHGMAGEYNLKDERIVKIINGIEAVKKVIIVKDRGHHLGKYRKNTLEYLDGLRPLKIYWNKNLTVGVRPYWIGLFLNPRIAGISILTQDAIIIGPATMFDKIPARLEGFYLYNSYGHTIFHEILHLTLGTPFHSKIRDLEGRYFYVEP